MNQDFETLPIGTEAALRDLVKAFSQPRRITWGYETEAMDKARAILAQIDAQRKGATDARN